MPKYTNEKQLQAAIVKALEAKFGPHIWVFHPVGGPYQVPGIPDLLVCYKGRFIGLELKHQKGGESLEHVFSRVTPQQELILKKIRECGGISGVVLNVADAVQFVAQAEATK